MSRFGIDYSAARFPGATLKARGVTFAIRYLRNAANPKVNKALTPAEAHDILIRGIDLVSNDETTGTQLLGGRPGGIADAKAADQAHRACGGPGDRPIYFSPWDHDPAALTAAQWQLLWDYLDGAASVLGRQRVGLYGGLTLIARAFDRKAITWGWQTYAWSSRLDPDTGRRSTHWDTRAHLQQYANGEWDGQVDFNRAMTADFGQWGHQTHEEDLTIVDAQTQQYLDGKFDAMQLRADWLALWIAGRANRVYTPAELAARLSKATGTKIEADFDTPTSPDALKQAFTTLMNRLNEGLAVTLDVSKLTPDQLALVGRAAVGALVIEGATLKDGKLILTIPA